MEWILASGSPRRRELLGRWIEKFEVVPSLADESAEGLAPAALVLELATRKAKEVAARVESEGKVVIGSDTVVSLSGEVLGKPKDEKDAFRMLRALSGRSHEVYTGVCFARQIVGRLETFADVVATKVYFKTLSDEWILDYIKSGSPMDKAGGYGIQDGGLVEKIEGSYTNVVGFPEELVREMIERAKEVWA